MSVSKYKLARKLRVCVVKDTQFSSFAIEYLHENEKIRETVFVCSYVAQEESFMQKNGRKFCDTVPLTSLN